MTFLFALITSVMVAIPWLLARRINGGITAAIASFFPALFFIWCDLPTTAGPLFGGIGFHIACFTAVFGLCSLGGKNNDTNQGLIPFYTSLGLAGIYIILGFANSTYVRATSYGALIPKIEAREWSADFQPKDPRHFRVSSSENAQFLATRAMGQATTVNANGQPNAIGSQFKVYDDVSSVQIIRNELWTIVPIDWVSEGPQFSGTQGVPGYIKVSGENPIIPAHYVTLKQGSEFKYTPEAIWGKNLNRLVWSHHMDKCIADIHLEIDEEDKPHYIVSLAEPTIGWWGEKVVGALIIDPTTGSGVEKFIPLGEVPAWVDRVEAEYIVHRNIDFHGQYALGFWNRSVYGNSILTATETHFGYGSDGQPVFATGITAHNNGNASDSLVAVYYTNTRTGKTVEYMLQGGATEKRAIEQCNLIGDVRNKAYHGTTPQLYNIYGHISYVVPLQNASHAFAGVAIVAVMNPQIIAWGQSAHEAELAYKQVIVANSSQMSIEGTRKLSSITGPVERVGSMLVSGSTTFFIQVKGMKHLFTVPVSASAKVPVTQIGDLVWVEYYDSGESVMPVNKFDNKSFELGTSENEADVQNRATVAIDEGRAKENEKSDVQSALEKLSPEERKLLEGKLKEAGKN